MRMSWRECCPIIALITRSMRNWLQAFKSDTCLKALAGKPHTQSLNAWQDLGVRVRWCDILLFIRRNSPSLYCSVQSSMVRATFHWWKFVATLSIFILSASKSGFSVAVMSFQSRQRWEISSYGIHRLIFFRFSKRIPYNTNMLNEEGILWRLDYCLLHHHLISALRGNKFRFLLKLTGVSYNSSNFHLPERTNFEYLSCRRKTYKESFCDHHKP